MLLQISKHFLNCTHHTMIRHRRLSREQKKQDGRKPDQINQAQTIPGVGRVHWLGTQPSEGKRASGQD